MSEYDARMKIKVSSDKVWERFKNVDTKYWNLYDEGLKDTFVFDGEGLDEFELEELVDTIAEVLGEDGIIIADTYNFNVDYYNHCIYYFGDIVESETFEETSMHLDTNIEDIAGWLNYAKFRLNKREKEQLKRFGIIYNGKKYENI